MASTKFDKTTREFKIFNSLWSLFQKYGIPDNTDEYWEQCIDEFEKVVSEQFNNDILACQFAVVILDELERKSKNG